MRLLLLALSGVRVQDEELNALGMTLPGFVERGRVIASLPSLGLLTVAAHTPPHWEIEYREADDGWDAEGFDLVAVSALAPRVHEAYEAADRLREAGTPTVLGGLHATACPEEAGRHFDAVVVGEAEPVWAQLLADVEVGALRPRYEAGAPFDLRHARTPRYDLLDVERYNRLTLQTTRGCPRGCVFCGASRLLGPYRKKPLVGVRSELEAIADRWPSPFLELADDNTFLDRPWSMDLARLLGEYSVRWFTETDLSVADDPALLDRLAESGCARLLIGLESPRQRSLRGVDPANWKEKQIAGSAAAVERIQSRGIAVTGCLVLGWDADDAGVFEETRDFASGLGLADVQVTLLTPFPGTELFDRLRAEGRLPAEPFWERCTLLDVTYEPRGMSAAALAQGFRWLVGELYTKERRAERRRRFADGRRTTRERAQ